MYTVHVALVVVNVYCLRAHDKVLKTAMGAAERALSTIRTTISGDSDKKEEKREAIMNWINIMARNSTAVLNAWYFAGFYTRRYLVEQSIANRRQG
ncbi:survival motor neuron protein [Senna tora]|uniref:Survival motor neuron protein n=1 Tax=Senna tora TaxID=362788 RepID=A0A834TG89_9FABA|nr:survival motor neuron protein [Senna tora]